MLYVNKYSFKWLYDYSKDHLGCLQQLSYNMNGIVRAFSKV